MPQTPGFLRYSEELLIVIVWLCERGHYSSSLRKTICRSSFGYPLADCSPAMPASVLPNGKILFLHLLSVKRFFGYLCCAARSFAMAEEMTRIAVRIKRRARPRATSISGQPEPVNRTAPATTKTTVLIIFYVINLFQILSSRNFSKA